ncbi:MAG TPA: hypothetical protein PLF17_11920 [Chitinophagaceae bacterium]|nr:hypothetical protein [Chitinophagaceae bacterium]
MKKKVSIIALFYYLITVALFILYPSLIKSIVFLFIYLVINISLIGVIYFTKNDK